MAAAPKKRNKKEMDLTKGHESTQYTDGSMGVHLPNEIPIYVRAFRLLGEPTQDRSHHVAGALEGWTVQLDAFTFGIKVFLRIGMDGTLRLYIDDEDGVQKLVGWEK